MNFKGFITCMLSNCYEITLNLIIERLEKSPDIWKWNKTWQTPKSLKIQASDWEKIFGSQHVW